jgi:hypothetical protein
MSPVRPDTDDAALSRDCSNLIIGNRTIMLCELADAAVTENYRVPGGFQYVGYCLLARMRHIDYQTQSIGLR